VTSLRGQLAFFWVILLTACAGLALVMLVLFRNSAGAQIEQVSVTAEQACNSIATRYAQSLANPQQAEPQLDLLQVILQLVLLETPKVEGGVWRSGAGFLAYAYPTYEGSSVKRDVPGAEQAHIAAVAQVVARTQQPQADVVRASRDALVVAACPLQAPGKDLVAWTMTRTSLTTLDAQRNLRIGLAALLAFVLVSGLWLGAILLRGYRHVQRLEAQLSGFGHDAQGAGDIDLPLNTEPMAPVGVAELDRVVAALNRYRSRLQQALAKLRTAERQRARDQRLAALGRMTGSVAHEIRNPIAAMRLKAENALAGSPDKQPEALRVILGQIARLDGLVQSLLAVVQPIHLQLQPVDLSAWLAERITGVEPAAQTKGVRITATLPAPGTAIVAIDPQHLGRAIDNLLDNAVRHARGAVQVLLSTTPQRLRIRVQDDGLGLPDTLRDQLFEPFASGRPEGTGLGLALAHEVALAHGGDLRELGRDEGQGHAEHTGACFELELPWRTS